jgi:lysophospholipase L1-like esterase
MTSPLLAGPSDLAPVDDSAWRAQFRVQKDRMGNVDICLLGDSLTAGWNSTGRVQGEKLFSGRRVANCGISGDLIENAHWRLRNYGALPSDTTIVILLGTNNLSKEPSDSVEDVVKGIQDIVRHIGSSLSPRIFILSLLPNGYDPQLRLRKDIVAANTLLRTGQGYEFLDIHDAFLDAEGRWKPGLTIDGTHLSAAGYEILAAALKPELDKLAPPTPSRPN